jgi:hypothetical protein
MFSKTNILFFFSLTYLHEKYKGVTSRGSYGAYAPDESNQGERICLPCKYALDEIRNCTYVSAPDKKNFHEWNRGQTPKKSLVLIKYSAPGLLLSVMPQRQKHFKGGAENCFALLGVRFLRLDENISTLLKSPKQ